MHEPRPPTMAGRTGMHHGTRDAMRFGSKDAPPPSQRHGRRMMTSPVLSKPQSSSLTRYLDEVGSTDLEPKGSRASSPIAGVVSPRASSKCSHSRGRSLLVPAEPPRDRFSLDAMRRSASSLEEQGGSRSPSRSRSEAGGDGASLTASAMFSRVNFRRQVYSNTRIFLERVPRARGKRHRLRDVADGVHHSVKKVLFFLRIQMALMSSASERRFRSRIQVCIHLALKDQKLLRLHEELDGILEEIVADETSHGIQPSGLRQLVSDAVHMLRVIKEVSQAAEGPSEDHQSKTTREYILEKSRGELREALTSLCQPPWVSRDEGTAARRSTSGPAGAERGQGGLRSTCLQFKMKELIATIPECTRQRLLAEFQTVRSEDHAAFREVCLRELEAVGMDRGDAKRVALALIKEGWADRADAAIRGLILEEEARAAAAFEARAAEEAEAAAAAQAGGGRRLARKSTAHDLAGSHGSSSSRTSRLTHRRKGCAALMPSKEEQEDRFEALVAYFSEKEEQEELQAITEAAIADGGARASYTGAGEPQPSAEAGSRGGSGAGAGTQGVGTAGAVHCAEEDAECAVGISISIDSSTGAAATTCYESTVEDDSSPTGIQRGFDSECSSASSEGAAGSVSGDLGTASAPGSASCAARRNGSLAGSASCAPHVESCGSSGAVGESCTERVSGKADTGRAAGHAVRAVGAQSAVGSVRRTQRIERDDCRSTTSKSMAECVGSPADFETSGGSACSADGTESTILCVGSAAHVAGSRGRSGGKAVSSKSTAGLAGCAAGAESAAGCASIGAGFACLGSALRANHGAAGNAQGHEITRHHAHATEDVSSAWGPGSGEGITEAERPESTTPSPSGSKRVRRQDSLGVSPGHHRTEASPGHHRTEAFRRPRLKQTHTPLSMESLFSDESKMPRSLPLPPDEEEEEEEEQQQQQQQLAWSPMQGLGHCGREEDLDGAAGLSCVWEQLMRAPGVGACTRAAKRKGPAAARNRSPTSTAGGAASPEGSVAAEAPPCAMELAEVASEVAAAAAAALAAPWSAEAAGEAAGSWASPVARAALPGLLPPLTPPPSRAGGASLPGPPLGEASAERLCKRLEALDQLQVHRQRTCGRSRAWLRQVGRPLTPQLLVPEASTAEQGRRSPRSARTPSPVLLIVERHVAPVTARQRRAGAWTDATYGRRRPEGCRSPCGWAGDGFSATAECALSSASALG